MKKKYIGSFIAACLIQLWQISSLMMRNQTAHLEKTTRVRIMGRRLLISRTLSRLPYW